MHYLRISRVTRDRARDHLFTTANISIQSTGALDLNLLSDRAEATTSVGRDMSRLVPFLDFKIAAEEIGSKEKKKEKKKKE